MTKYGKIGQKSILPFSAAVLANGLKVLANGLKVSEVTFTL